MCTIEIVQNRGIGDLIFALGFVSAYNKKFPDDTMLWNVPNKYHALLKYFGQNIINPRLKPNKTIDLNKNIATKNFTLHEIERYLKAHSKYDLKIEDVEYPGLNLHSNKKSILISLAANIPTRRWITENYIKLANNLIDKKFQVTIIGGSDVFEMAQVIAKASTANNLVGKLKLLDTTKLIAESEYIIANDTGLAHIAAAVGTPLFVMSFNKVQNNFRWMPWSDEILAIRGHFNCNKVCHSSECTLDHCRKALTYEKVWTELIDFFKGKRNGKNKKELIKDNIFFLFTEKTLLYNNLLSNSYCVSLYNSKEGLTKQIIRDNINIIVNPRINKTLLTLKLLYASNFVSEYPLIYKTTTTNINQFIEEFLVWIKKQ